MIAMIFLRRPRKIISQNVPLNSTFLILFISFFGKILTFFKDGKHENHKIYYFYHILKSQTDQISSFGENTQNYFLLKTKWFIGKQKCGNILFLSHLKILNISDL